MTLYTTHCPKCLVLETKLKESGESYNQVTDIEVMKKKNMNVLPYLELDDGTLLSFVEAVKYINSK